MNNMQKLLIFAGLIISTLSLFAENKEVVYIINNYEKDVAINLLWSPKIGSGFLYDQMEERILKKDNIYKDTFSNDNFDKKFQHKTPYSKYYLHEIKAIPATNTWGHTNLQVTVNTTLAIPSAIAHVGNFYNNSTQDLVHDLWDFSLDKNEDLIIFNEQDKYKGSLFFVIENNGKKSKISGQKQIEISYFLSKDDCKKYLLKDNSGEAQDDQISKGVIFDEQRA